MVVDLARSARRWPEASTRARWQTMRALVAVSVLLVYASYWFVMEPPQAHAFYVLAPGGFLLAAYWWPLLDPRRAGHFGGPVLPVGIAFPAGLAGGQAP